MLMLMCRMCHRSEDDIRGYFQALRIEQPIEQPTFPEAREEDFKKWFPGLQLSRTACPNPRYCQAPDLVQAEFIFQLEATTFRVKFSLLGLICFACSIICIDC